MQVLGDRAVISAGRVVSASQVAFVEVEVKVKVSLALSLNGKLQDNTIGFAGQLSRNSVRCSCRVVLCPILLSIAVTVDTH